MSILRRLRTRTRSVSCAYAVFERDFLVFTSQRRFLVTRTLAVFVPALVIAVIVLNGLDASPDVLGQQIFLGGAVTVPCLVMLLASAVAAPAIAGERKLRTLDIVLVAPVGPWSFVGAKFISRLGTVLVLIFGTLPISALCLVYGGVSFVLFLDAVALSVAFAVWGVAVGILASAYCRSVGPAVLLAYGLSVLAPVVYTIVLGLTGAWNSFPPTGFAFVAAAFSSFLAWFGVLGATFGGGTLGGPVGPGVAHLGTAVVVAIPALLLAGARIRDEAARTSSGPRTVGKRLRIRTGLPVLDRGLHGSLLSSPGWGAAGLFAAVLAVEALSIWGGVEARDLDDSWPHLMAMWCVGGIVCFAVLASAAGGIASERQQGSLALLLTSPLGTSRIVAAKLASVLLAVVPLLALPLVHAVIALPGSDLRPATVLTWAVSLSVVLFLLAAIGVRISIAASSAGRAVMTVFGIVLGGIVAHGVLIFVLALFGSSTEDIGTFLAGASPPVVLVALPMLVDKNASAGSWQVSERMMFGSCVFWLLAYGVLATLLLASADAALGRSRE